MFLHAPWSRLALRNARAAVGLSCALLASTARAGAPATSEASEATDDPLPISGGTAAAVCALPDVLCGMTSPSGGCNCTATLVHPSLVLYAAHCGRLTSFKFGEQRNGPTLTASKAMVNPAYGKEPDPNNDVDVDWAFSVLTEPVTNVPVTPVAYGCELDQVVKPGQAVIQAGFGAPSSGKKYWRANTIATLSSPQCPTCEADGIIAVGKGGIACPGDSGGPLLVQMSDMSWRTIGITSTLIPDPPQCGGSSAWNDYSRVRRPMIEWVETNSGVDITPCFDLDGTWNPKAECTNFFAGTPMTGVGTWSNNCQGTPSVASTLCAGTKPDGGGAGGSGGTGGGATDGGQRDAAKDGPGGAAGSGGAGGAGSGGAGGAGSGGTGSAGSGGGSAGGAAGAGGGAGGAAGGATGGSGGAGGVDAGSAGAAGAIAGSAGASRTTTGSISTNPGESDGCSCRIPGAATGSARYGALGWLSVAGAAFVARSRRRREGTKGRGE